MSQFIPTFTIAFVLVIFSLTALGIGYILTRKKCLRHGCGKNPHDPNNKCCCGSSNACDSNEPKE